MQINLRAASAPRVVAAQFGLIRLASLLRLPWGASAADLLLFYLVGRTILITARACLCRSNRFWRHRPPALADPGTYCFEAGKGAFSNPISLELRHRVETWKTRRPAVRAVSICSFRLPGPPSGSRSSAVRRSGSDIERPRRSSRQTTRTSPGLAMKRFIKTGARCFGTTHLVAEDPLATGGSPAHHAEDRAADHPVILARTQSPLSNSRGRRFTYLDARRV